MTRKSTSAVRQLARDTQGAVFAEGVIVLPFLIIVLAGVVFSHRAYRARIKTAVTARTCAWSYANAGCGDARKPSACKYGPAAHAGLASVGDFAAPRDAKRDFRRGAKDISRHVSQFIDSGLRLGDGVTATAEKSVRRPAVLGGGRTDASGCYSVLCNETKRTPLAIVKTVYCLFGDSMPGCPVRR